MKRGTFIFYTEWLEYLSEFNEVQRLRMYETIIKYAMHGTHPHLDDIAERIVFKFIKSTIDRDMMRYEARTDDY